MEIVKEKTVSNLQSGQILLITLLVMVVGLTMALAVIARSVTSIKVSTQEEESQRAFYAAEAGLEEALLPGATLSLGVEIGIGDASYILAIPPPTPGKFVFPDLVKKDETQSVWLVGHDINGEILAPRASGEETSRYPIDKPIDVCWEGPGTGSVPAMEITIIHQKTTGSNPPYGVARGAYDPDSGRRGQNHFSDVTDADGSNCGDFDYSQTINFSSFFSINNERVVALRLRPIYNDARVAVAVTSGYTAAVPPQGNEIESLGKAGTAQRKLKVFRAYSSFPPIFDYVLFSGKPLGK